MSYDTAAAVLPAFAIAWTVGLSLTTGRALWRAGQSVPLALVGAGLTAAAIAAGSSLLIPLARGLLAASARDDANAAALLFGVTVAVLVMMVVALFLRAGAGGLTVYQLVMRLVEAALLVLAGFVAGPVVAGAWRASAGGARPLLFALVWMAVVAGYAARPRRAATPLQTDARSGSAVAADGARVTSRRTAADLVQTAQHEAAHAVVAHALGLQVDQVDLHVTCSRLGATTLTAPASSTDNLYDLMTVFLAADVAVVSGRGPELGAEDDIARAATAALSIAGRAITPTALPEDTPLRLEDLMRCARARACGLLARDPRSTAQLVERLVADPGRPVIADELATLLSRPAPTGAR